MTPMSKKWLAPLSLVGSLAVGSFIAACGEQGATTATTVLNLGAPAYATLPVTQTTLPPQTALPPLEGQVMSVEQSYQIQYNDNLMKIANIYRVSAEAIATANGWVDGTAHLIYPGDIIKIPVGAIFPYATTTTIMTAPPTTEVCVKEKYTIQSGDSPTKVANKYGITMQQLGAANVKTRGYKNFVVGVEINIPCDDGTNDG